MAGRHVLGLDVLAACCRLESMVKDDTDVTVTTGELSRLFDTTPKTIAALGGRGIIISAGKRGRWQLRPSVAGYVRHLREQAADRGGDDAAASRARLGSAQASLAEARAERLRGEVLPTKEVEALWTRKLKGFRARILAIPERLRDLNARQSVKLWQEIRAALTELAEDKAARR